MGDYGVDFAGLNATGTAGTQVVSIGARTQPLAPTPSTPTRISVRPLVPSLPLPSISNVKENFTASGSVVLVAMAPVPSSLIR